jgi:L-fuculose-phosphate aldolase
MVGRDIFEAFQALGRDLFVSGLISSHGGNISCLDSAVDPAADSAAASPAASSAAPPGQHPRIFITRTGSALGRLRSGDVVAVSFDQQSDLATLKVSRGEYVHTSTAVDADELASIELIVHRALYHRLPQTRAVVHTHSPFTTLLSLHGDAIEPLDSEARHFLPRVPVIAPRETIASAEVARLLPEVLAECACPVAVVRGHGPFATGATLAEAWRWVSVLELSSRLLIEQMRLPALAADSAKP